MSVYTKFRTANSFDVEHTANCTLLAMASSTRRNTPERRVEGVNIEIIITCNKKRSKIKSNEIETKKRCVEWCDVHVEGDCLQDTSHVPNEPSSVLFLPQPPTTFRTASHPIHRQCRFEQMPS
eukprot:scaffold382760_cov70-Cyclotella_meneghiniana.AAC.1